MKLDCDFGESRDYIIREWSLSRNVDSGWNSIRESGRGYYMGLNLTRVLHQSKGFDLGASSYITRAGLTSVTFSGGIITLCTSDLHS